MRTWRACRIAWPRSSKVLAVIAALFGPMTVITGLFGMNVPLPTLLGSPSPVLVDHRHHGAVTARSCSCGSQDRAGVDGPHHQASRRSRQSDCRRRSRRAAGLGRQGAGRKRHRRRRDADRDHSRIRRQEADSRRRRRPRHGPGRCAAVPRAACHEQDHGAPRTSRAIVDARVSRRSAAVASRRCRISGCARGRGAATAAPRFASTPASSSRWSRRAAPKARWSKWPTCSTTCRRGGSS